MNLNPIIEQSINYYSWTPAYAKQVAFEYNRFLELRSINSNLSPSDDIDRLWHLHLLNPILYYDYCATLYHKIIDHNPTDSFNQHARQQRLQNTITEYLKNYDNFTYPNVWNYKTKSKSKEQPKLKSESESNNPNEIKVTIYYTFDTKTNNDVRKIWNPDNGYDQKYGGKTFIIDTSTQPNNTIENLTKRISKLTGHNAIAVQFYPDKDKNDVLNGMNTKNGFRWNISEHTLLSDIKYNLVCILEQMSQHGYC
ncbi:MAG: hypothetical protein Gaeavirus6_17 [Gaeavirus sp.]|uniref:Uncharacterized protein n=1 Tax=Gaeavirus sp. TaxID=2487767 RepID=A0A3G4ZYS9_9VIRU|nr:MAG: hypothetical protein Gaeavirus6_17 [Gaeavirus sp.]